jgi:bis(5'-nucleosidyl)-tetraphosphatase
MKDGIVGNERYIIGLIVFDGERFLLLHRKLNWCGWEFPKGAIEGNETHEEAVKRELCEETGIRKFSIVTKLNEFDFYDKVRSKTSHITDYLLQVSSNSKVTINNEHALDGKIVEEHDDFKWFFPKDAVKTLTHKNQKETLKLAIEHLGLEG